jgi:outer membrane cobalamin receptor
MNHALLRSFAGLVAVVSLATADAQDNLSDGPGDIVVPDIVSYVSASVVEQRTVISREDIKKKNAKTVDELFGSVGIPVKSYGAYGNASAPSIRGFTGSTVKVFIDGVCVNSAQNGTFDFSSLDVNSIERIEIVRGGFSEDVASEGAAGGSIYITTRKMSLGRRFEADGSARTFFGQPFDAGTLSLGYSGPAGGDTFVNAGCKGVFARNEFPFMAIDGQRSVRADNEVIDANASVSVTRFFGGGNSVSLSDGLYAGRKSIPGTSTSTTVGVQEDASNLFSAGVQFPSIAGTYGARGTISLKSDAQSYTSPGESSRHHLETLSFSGSAEYSGNTPVRQAIGGSVNSAFMDSTNVGSVFLASGFVKETTTLSGSNGFSLIVPLSLSFSGTNLAFVPKMGLRADFATVSVMLDGYRLCLFPDMNQLYWGGSSYASGNRDLKPEDGWGGELALDVRNGYMPFSVAAFGNYYFNKIQWQGINGKWMPQNVASALFLGFDAKCSFSVFSFLSVGAEYEYLYNRLLADGITHGKRIMYTPEHTGSLSALLSLRPATISVDAQYVGLQYLSNLNAGFLDPYLLVNGSVTFHPVKGLAPYVRVLNILNESYETSDGYPMPGISLEAGVRVEL